MKMSRALPAAFLLLLFSWVASSRDDASPVLLPRTADLPACRPDRALGPDGGRRYDAVIIRHARKRGLNPRLVKAIIAAESQFSPRAVSSCGARGLMQVMPSTAEGLGIRACDLSDPETNISAGTEYLAQLFRAARRRAGERAPQSRVARRVIAAYHSGPGALSGKGWSEPTRRYVRTVLSCYESDGSAVRAPRRADASVAMLPADRRGGVW